MFRHTKQKFKNKPNVYKCNRYNRECAGNRRELNALFKYTSINFGHQLWRKTVESILAKKNIKAKHASVHARELRACPASVCGAAAACVVPICKRMQMQARVSGRAGVVHVITAMHSVHVRHVYSSVDRACVYAAFLLCTAVLASPMGVLT